MKQMSAVLISTFILVSCVATPPSIKTNVRPAVLDYASVVAVADHDQHTTSEQFFEAVESGETFGYCLPMGPNRSTAVILCFVTEAGDVYAILDHTQEAQATTLYEIGPAVRRSRNRYFVPMLDVDVNLD